MEEKVMCNYGNRMILWRCLFAFGQKVGHIIMYWLCDISHKDKSWIMKWNQIFENGIEMSMNVELKQI